ncbi:MAG: cation transporter [Lachnospiraceae bacterium]|nr:cation transporter [Lachnospiraceae bacterium]
MEQDNYEKTAMKVSYISIISNIFLSVFKMIAGLVAHSGAMVSDSIHSASDVISTIVVIIGIKLSGKDSDDEHPYGHERLECVAATLLATILGITGFMIGYNAIRVIISNNYNPSEVPGKLAMVAAIVSILVKESMFWYTRAYAKKIDSGTLMADAWHHRSDSLSSIGAMVGILFARHGFPVMDSIASIIICVLIVKAALEIYIDAINKMVDKSCDLETQEKIKQVALSQKGVLGIDLINTRMFGNKIYVDMEICADGELKLKDSHQIAENVHEQIEKEFPKVKHIMVHVNPKL